MVEGRWDLRYRLCMPTGSECGDPRFLVELAQRAEAGRWEGAFLRDYVCYQGPVADEASVQACGNEMLPGGRLHAAHDDRNRVVELLRVAAGDGRLTME